MERDSWFRDRPEAVWFWLIVFVGFLLTLLVFALTLPDSYRITSIAAFGIALGASAGLSHLATQSRWRSKSLVVWVVLVHVAVVLSVPLLALTVFPDWITSASAGSFQSVPYAVGGGFLSGLFLLIFTSIARLFTRWWSAWRGG